MPLPFTEEGRAQQALLSSQEYLGASPEGRKEMLGIFKSASPADRKRFIFGEGETPGLTPAPKRAAKEGLSMLSGMVKKSLSSAPEEIGEGTGSGMIDMGGAAVGAITGGYLGSKTGIPGAGKLGATLGEAGGAYLANQGNKLLGMREGKAFGTPDTSDYLSAGIPLGVRTVAGTAKLATKPAQTRLLKSDTKAQEIITTHKERIEDLKHNAALTNQERSAQASQMSQETNQLLKDHYRAAQDTYKNATAGMNIPDPGPAYAASKKAAALAPPMDVSGFNKVAQKAGLDLESPVQGYNPMARVAGSLKDWSAGQPVPIDEVLDTYQELGWVVGHAKGKQLKVAGEMRAQLKTMLDDQKKTSSEAATAIEKHAEGQAAWKRKRSFEEFEDILEKGKSNPAPGEYRVKTAKIRDRFNALKENQHFRDATTTNEVAQMQAQIDLMPTVQPGKPPKGPKVKTVDIQGQEMKLDRKLEKLGDKTKEPGPYPTSKAFLAQAIGGTLGAAGAHMTGAFSPYAGALVGAAGGAGAVAVPHWVSNTLMKSDKGQQFVRNIMAGKRALTPAIVAGMTSAARSLGGKPEEDE